MQKRKITESLEMKKFTLRTESSIKTRLALTQSLTLKKSKLVKKSRIDIMMRRKKSETIKELRKYKDEEMKKIDSEVSSMKHDLLSYMLKELEEQKKLMQMNMEKGIEEEKVQRLKEFEIELSSKDVDEKYVQTNSYPESIDEKYEEILKELKDIKHSSNLCRNMLTKSNVESSTSSTKDSANSPFLDKSISRRLVSSSVSLSSPPVLTACEDFNLTPHTSTQYSYGSNRSLLPKMSHTTQNLPPHQIRKKNLGTAPDITTRYPSYLSTKDNIPGSNNTNAKETNIHSKESLISHIANLANRESGKKFAVKSSSRDGNSYSKTIMSPSERYLAHQKAVLSDNSSSFHNADTSLVERSTPSYEDIVILEEQNLSPGDLDASMVSRSSSFHENASLYRDTITVKEEFSDSSEHSLLTPDNNFTSQNLTQQDTATYIRNLLSSEQNNSLCNENSSMPEENTAAYIKKLLISSQLGPPDITSSSYNNNTQNLSLPYGDVTYHGKPALMSSEDTALYIKNLLMSSHGNTTSQGGTQVGKDTTSSFSKTSFLANSASHMSIKSDMKQNFAFGAKKKVYPHADSSAYNIYTYNKKLISTQEKRGMQHRSANDIKSYSVRKKRELNKRIYEKYGPLKNHKEIAEMIQSDVTFLSLPAMERYGILSCLTRSVAEHLTLSKDLLEELFSREVLSISSCKGSPIKTALNPDKLVLIRKIVFFALPSHDEKALWEMIQDSIDTKCRGILRNMKKKLSKQSLFEC